MGFRRKAFLHWYTGEGMDEMEFTEAESNITTWYLSTSSTRMPPPRRRESSTRKRRLRVRRPKRLAPTKPPHNVTALRNTSSTNTQTTTTTTITIINTLDL